MSDPLSVAASVAGLISLADVITRTTFKYIKEAKGAAKEIQRLLEETTDLYGTLNKLGLIVSRYQEHSFDSTVLAKNLRSCQGLLQKIKERLDRADPHCSDPTKPSSHRRTLLVSKSLTWPFSSIETKSLLQELIQQKSTLSLSLEVDAM